MAYTKENIRMDDRYRRNGDLGNARKVVQLRAVLADRSTDLREALGVITAGYDVTPVIFFRHILTSWGWRQGMQGEGCTAKRVTQREYKLFHTWSMIHVSDEVRYLWPES